MTKLATILLLAACSKGTDKKEFDDYMKRSKSIEAKLHLTKLSRMLKLHLEEKGNFPTGRTGPLPAETCCKGANGTCAPVPYATWSADPVWSALDFAIEEAPRFQYAYQSDGTTVTATATGDLDCDGKPIVFKLEMTATTMNLVEPAVSAD